MMIGEFHSRPPPTRDADRVMQSLLLVAYTRLGPSGLEMLRLEILVAVVAYYGGAVVVAVISESPSSVLDIRR